MRFAQPRTGSSLWTTAVALIAASAAALSLAACCSALPSFNPNGSAMTSRQLEQLVGTADSGGAAAIDFEKAPAERQAALARLRAQGADGARAADMLTKGFPASDASVPFLVSIASVDGKKSVIVVEAWGTAGGKLGEKQLWLFDWESGAIVRVIRATRP